MAKKLVKVSLATKLRILFAAAVMGIIAAALLVPWYLTELQAEQGVLRAAAELTRLRLNEWVANHSSDQPGQSRIADFYTAEDTTGQASDIDQRKGPTFIRIGRDMTPILGLTASPSDVHEIDYALKAFLRDSGQVLAVIKSQQRNQRAHRSFRAVRVDSGCVSSGCHSPSEPIDRQLQPNELVGLIDITMPAHQKEALEFPVWLTRGAFIAGGGLAALLAIIVFATITQRLILRPIRQLRDVSDRATDGDLSVRSTIQTGDELQRLGESFNEMLTAISDQHSKLRSANRALDLKLNELAEANVSLYQANQIKSEFLANISHELRTPLNSIIGFADLIGESGDEKFGRYGNNIVIAARTLLNMINDLLDLAKIEAGRAEIRLDTVSVSDICQTLAALMEPLADKKHLTMNVELEDDLPLVVTDGGKFQQILYNMLSNAIKFTPTGGSVTLSAKRHAAGLSGQGRNEVAVAVADTGPGIAETEQPHIFEKFYQVDRTLTRESSGTGLGLAISRELAALLGGRLTLDSSPGHGAVFTIFLPIDGPGGNAPNQSPFRSS